MKHLFVVATLLIFLAQSLLAGIANASEGLSTEDAILAYARKMPPKSAGPSTPSTTQAKAPCEECSVGNGTAGLSVADAIAQYARNMHSITNGALDIEIISDKFNYSEKCDKFAADGSMNIWGDLISREATKPRCNRLIEQGPRDIKRYCPNWDFMDYSERKGLVVLVVTGMSHYESSCNFRETAPGPNGTAIGLLQLHKNHEQSYSTGCRNGDGQSPERTLTCGVAMVCDQVGSRGENLFSSASYWEVLRPRGRSQKAKKIMAAIQNYPSCGYKTANTKRNNRNRVAEK